MIHNRTPYKTDGSEGRIEVIYSQIKPLLNFSCIFSNYILERLFSNKIAMRCHVVWASIVCVFVMCVCIVYVYVVFSCIICFCIVYVYVVYFCVIWVCIVYVYRLRLILLRHLHLYRVRSRRILLRHMCLPFGTPRPILDQALDVCRRSNMLRKLTCIAGSSYSSAALNEIIP